MSIFDAVQPPLEWRTVPVSGINARDTAFRINTTESWDFLARNIRKVGLLRPPVLQRISTRPESFRIISGFRRVRAWMETEIPDIPAGILDSSVPELAAAQIAVSEQIFQGPLNPIEISNALNLFGKWADTPSALSNLAKKFGLPDNPAMIEKSRKFSDLPAFIRKAVAEGIIPVAMASELTEISEPGRSGIADVLIALRPSLNKQRDILTLIQEISLREQSGIPELLKSGPVSDILDDPNQDRNQKIRRLRTYLKQRRYPELSRAETRLRAQLDTLPKFEGIEVVPPPYMEGSNFIIRLQFSTNTDLDRLLPALHQIAAHPAFTDLMDDSG